jgi:glycosyltransferase involved in cell wall biosynthesis
MNSSSSLTLSRMKLVAVMEPKTVTGAAKNMLDFCSGVRELNEKFPDFPTFDISIITFERFSNFDTLPGQNSLDSANSSTNEFVVTAREMGLEVEIIPERKRFDFRVVSALRQIIEQRDPDIILSHHVKSHLVVKISKVWRRYPWVAFHHGYTNTQPRERVYNRMDRLSLPKADRVVTVCEAFARELESRAGVLRERIHVQHNSIGPTPAGNEDQVEELRRQIGIANDEKLVLSIGRLSREKGHIDLVLAFKHLREIYPELKSKLVIVGEGPERERLEATAGSPGLSASVVFAGQIRNVQPYYALADVLVLPSHSEGSPYVLLEAMAAGVPIVATAVGGVPEMVAHEESALLVPPEDPRAMASAIARVLGAPEIARKLTTNGARLVATSYAPETQIRSLTNLYLSILKERQVVPEQR